MQGTYKERYHVTIQCGTCNKDVTYDSSRVNSNWDIPTYCGQVCYWYRDPKWEIKKH